MDRNWASLSAPPVKDKIRSILANILFKNFFGFDLTNNSVVFVKFFILHISQLLLVSWGQRLYSAPLVDNVKGPTVATWQIRDSIHRPSDQ